MGKRESKEWAKERAERKENRERTVKKREERKYANRANGKKSKEMAGEERLDSFSESRAGSARGRRSGK